MIRPPLLFLLSLVVVAGDASAHTETIAGREPFVEDGVVVGGGSTWGVLRPDGEGGYTRVCEESLGAPTNFFIRAVDDTVLLGSGDGLFRTDDGGCTYSAVAAAADRAAVAHAVDPENAAVAFVVTSEPGVENAVLVSSDGALTFSERAALPAGLLWNAIVVGPNAAFVVVTGVDPAAGPVVYAAVGDEPLAALPAVPAGTALLRALSVDDGVVAFGALDTLGGGRLWRAPALSLGDVATWTERAAFDGEPTAFVAYAGKHLVSVNRSRLLRADDATAAFVDIDGPTRCLLRVPGDDRLWGCGQQRDRHHFFVSSDGVAFEPLLPFIGVTDRECPAGTVGYEACAYVFDDASGDGGVFTRDGGSGGGDDDEFVAGPSCGCGASSRGDAGALVAAALLVLLWIVRRRRNDRRR